MAACMKHVVFGKFRTFCTLSPKSYVRISDILVKDCSITENVCIKGWIKAVRDMKTTCFLHVSDGSTMTHLQIVLPHLSMWNIDMNYGSCVEVCGKVVDSPASGQSVELMADSIKLINTTDIQDFPFPGMSKHRYPADVCRQYLHLRHKLDLYQAVMRIRNSLMMNIHKYYQDRGYMYVHTPILTSNDCEGGGETFTVTETNEEVGDVNRGESDDDGDRIFPHPVYLSVSGQLHLEAMANGISHVYTMGPSFRAERGKTNHHLCEFTMCEAEVAFCDDIESLIQHMSHAVSVITQQTVRQCGEELMLVRRQLTSRHSPHSLHSLHSPRSPHSLTDTSQYVRLSYSEALGIVNESQGAARLSQGAACESSGAGSESQGADAVVEWGERLSGKAERVILERYQNEVPVLVTHSPITAAPFYARLTSPASPALQSCSGQQATCETVDLLLPGVGEVCGGSVRAAAPRLTPPHTHTSPHSGNNLQWYADIRRFGAAPSSGYGIGFDRLVQFITGVPNIRDCVPFPRWPHSCRH